MDRRLESLFVAGLALLAGCGSLGALDDTPTPTAEPPYVAAPGLSPTGVDDPAQLAAAHRASLLGVSYTLRTSLVVREPDGAVRATRTTTVRVGPDGRRFALDQRAAGRFPEAIRPQVNVSAWSPGPHTYVRVEPATRQARYTRYDGGYAAAVVVLDGHEAIGIYLAGVRNATVEAVTADGWLAYRLEATDDDGVRTVAVVDSFGLLRSLVVVSPADEVFWLHEPGTVVRTLAYERVGVTTVERPAWVDEAVLATAGADGSDRGTDGVGREATTLTNGSTARANGTTPTDATTSRTG